MSALRLGPVLVCALFGAGCTTTVPEDAAAETVRPRGFLAALAAPAVPKAAPMAEPALPFARVPLAGGDVVVAGPDGYCIDPATIDRSTSRGFAMIASCRILSAGRAGFAVEPLLVTVTVGPRGEAGDLPDAAALSEIAGAPLLGGVSETGFSAAHLGSGGARVLDGGDDRYWRATFLQGGRLVGLALYAPNGSAMAGPLGQGMLRAVQQRIVALSPGRSAPAATAPAPARTETQRPARQGVAGRLSDGQDLS